MRPKTLLQLSHGTVNMVSGMASNQPRDSGESPEFVGPNDSKGIFCPKWFCNLVIWEERRVSCFHHCYSFTGGENTATFQFVMHSVTLSSIF